jgi:hypothetical protein
MIGVTYVKKPPVNGGPNQDTVVFQGSSQSGKKKLP